MRYAVRKVVKVVWCPKARKPIGVADCIAQPCCLGWNTAAQDDVKCEVQGGRWRRGGVKDEQTVGLQTGA